MALKLERFYLSTALPSPALGQAVFLAMGLQDGEECSLARFSQCSPCFVKRFLRLILALRPANRVLTLSVQAAWLSVSATPQRGRVIWRRVAGSSTPLTGSWDTHWNSLSGGIEIKDHKRRVSGRSEGRELPWRQQEAGTGAEGSNGAWPSGNTWEASLLAGGRRQSKLIPHHSQVPSIPRPTWWHRWIAWMWELWRLVHWDSHTSPGMPGGEREVSCSYCVASFPHIGLHGIYVMLVSPLVPTGSMSYTAESLEIKVRRT